MIGSVHVHDEFSPARSRARTALVVEDDESVRRMLERHLTRAGFTVRLAATEAEAVRQAVGSDVVIVDLGLTEGDGATLCERLRERAATAALPIIVLTARDDLATKLRLFAAGADDYLTKPFEPLELLVRIEAIARRTVQIGDWRKVGPLEVSGEGDVLIHRRPLLLTAAERELMSRLAAAYPGAASHEDLRHGTWRRSDASTANVVEVIVARIRKKIAAGGGGIDIRAIRGAGYTIRISASDHERE